MRHESEQLITDVMTEDALEVEDRMLQTLMGAVKRRRNFRRVNQIGAVSLVAVAAFWSALNLGPGAPSVEVAIENNSPPIVFLIDSAPDIELVDSSPVVHPLETGPITIRMIDDTALEQIFAGRAYAILDDEHTGGRVFRLLDMEAPSDTL